MFLNKLWEKKNPGQLSLSSLNSITNQLHLKALSWAPFLWRGSWIQAKRKQPSGNWLHMHSDSATGLSIQGHLPNICHDDIILLERPIESTLCIDCNFSPLPVSYLRKIIQLDTLLTFTILSFCLSIFYVPYLNFMLASYTAVWMIQKRKSYVSFGCI